MKNNNEDIRKRIGERIRELRESRGLSIRKLSEEIGIHQCNISAIENGKYNVRLDTLEKYEGFFNVKLEFTDTD